MMSGIVRSATTVPMSFSPRCPSGRIAGVIENSGASCPTLYPVASRIGPRQENRLAPVVRTVLAKGRISPFARGDATYGVNPDRPTNHLKGCITSPESTVTLDTQGIQYLSRFKAQHVRSAISPVPEVKPWGPALRVARKEYPGFQRDRTQKDIDK